MCKAACVAKCALRGVFSEQDWAAAGVSFYSIIPRSLTAGPLRPLFCLLYSLPRCLAPSVDLCVVLFPPRSSAGGIYDQPLVGPEPQTHEAVSSRALSPAAAPCGWSSDGWLTIASATLDHGRAPQAMQCVTPLGYMRFDPIASMQTCYS